MIYWGAVKMGFQQHEQEQEEDQSGVSTSKKLGFTSEQKPAIASTGRWDSTKRMNDSNNNGDLASIELRFN